MLVDNLSEFGIRELKIAGQLLTTYKTSKDKTQFLNDEGVKVFFNNHSGYVFLSDSDYNVAIMNGDNLEDFITCPECGFEDVASDFKDCQYTCCQEHAANLGL